MINKKGLSEVVTTVLIILLAIVAITIVWFVVRNVIKSGSEEADIRKVSLDLNILEARVRDSVLNIRK